MKKIVCLIFFLPCLVFGSEIVLSTKRLEFQDFPGAHNPSIIKAEKGYLLTFRYISEPWGNPFVSYIGIVLLDDQLNPVGEPEILNTRAHHNKIPSQSEDARIFSWRGRLFVIYNDNIELLAPATWQRRDMYMAELFCADGHYTLSSPLKLFHEGKYSQQMWQKNWVPFEWSKQLLITYTIHPHEILYLNWLTGACYPCHETTTPLNWQWGSLRGSTPPLLVDGQYLAFFHSGIPTTSPSSKGFILWHYFMGAYTFSADPPFALTRISPEPIVADGFYTESGYYKRVIFPGGFVMAGSKIYVAYGKDDCEIWIATLDKEALMKSLISVNEEDK